MKFWETEKGPKYKEKWQLKGTPQLALKVHMHSTSKRMVEIIVGRSARGGLLHDVIKLRKTRDGIAKPLRA